MSGGRCPPWDPLAPDRLRAQERARSRVVLSSYEHALLRGVEAYLRARRKGWAPHAVPVEGQDSLKIEDALLQLAPVVARAGRYSARIGIRVLEAMAGGQDELEIQCGGGGEE